MPTYERSQRFLNELKRLTPEQRLQFEAAVRDMVADIKAKRPFRQSLGVKRFKSMADTYEMAWVGDDRALFQYGTSPHPGETHVIWISVGTHDIYKR